MLRCTDLTAPNTGEETQLIQFLVEMATRAATGSPGFSNPIEDAQEREIEIELPPSPLKSEGEISLDC